MLLVSDKMIFIENKTALLFVTMREPARSLATTILRMIF